VTIIITSADMIKKRMSH